MTDQHPITPPPELVQQWASESLATQHLCTQAARWGYQQRVRSGPEWPLADQQLKLDGEQISQAWQKGADQELEACCAWMKLEGHEHEHTALRAARRPQLPPETLEVDGHTYRLVK